MATIYEEAVNLKIIAASKPGPGPWTYRLENLACEIWALKNWTLENGNLGKESVD